MKTSKKKMLALVHLINCKLFQSFYKHKIRQLIPYSKYVAVRAGAPWRSTQESHFETSR